MKTVVLIPARIGSTRLPRKPLIEINGKPLIQHVYERASSCLKDTYVVTDSIEILSTVQDFGGCALLVDGDCDNGTERCWMGLRQLGVDKYDFVINIQGDMVLFHEDHIKQITEYIPSRTIVTLASKLERIDNLKQGMAFVVLDEIKDAIYFSRSPIPLYPPHYQHIGIYAYDVHSLEFYYRMGKSPLEESENLEQLRWLYGDKRIKVLISDKPFFSIDTESDLKKAVKMLKNNGS